MKSRMSLAMVVLLVCLGLLIGCAPTADYSARFLGYTTLQDGTRVAVVAPLAESTEAQTAYTNIRDLKPDEIVLVRWVGRSWEMAQWKPEREIVSRGSGE